MLVDFTFVPPYTEGELDEGDEEDDLLAEIEMEQAAPVIPIPAPVEPPVKRKRGRPPKNKPDGEFLNGDCFELFMPVCEHAVTSEVHG